MINIIQKTFDKIVEDLKVNTHHNIYSTKNRSRLSNYQIKNAIKLARNKMRKRSIKLTELSNTNFKADDKKIENHVKTILLKKN